LPKTVVYCIADIPHLQLLLKPMSGFVDNIEDLTLNNSNFRSVIFTGKHTQLVLMCLQPGEEIGKEVHPDVDQFFRFEKGQGRVQIDQEEFTVSDGFAVVVPAGLEHNVINISPTDNLKFYTLYSPPHHRDQVVHQTKSDAQMDLTDQPEVA